MKNKNKNVDLEEILKKACWTNAKTFEKYYKKEGNNNFNKILDFKKIYI